MRPEGTVRCVAIGELLWDLLPSGPRLGGTTANFAMMSARLGASSSLVSCLGDDELGARARAMLAGASDSLDTTPLQSSQTLPTGTVGVTLGPGGQPSYEIRMPVAWDGIEWNADVAKVAAEADVLCFGSLAQRREPSRTTIRRMVETARPDCLRVCDVNLRMPFCDAETLRWCVEHSTLLKISDEELPTMARLLGLDELLPLAGGSFAGELGFARALLVRTPGCRLIAVTLGARGSLLVDRDGEHREEVRPVEVVDTIGAGDAFTAGMVYAYVQGGTLAQISVVGNLCGSFVASQPGATPEVPDWLREEIAEALG